MMEQDMLKASSHSFANHSYSYYDYYEHKKGPDPTISSLFVLAEESGVKENRDLFFGRVPEVTIQSRLEAALQRKRDDWRILKSF